MHNYRRLNNPVLCYVEEQCELADGAEVSKADLYDNYKEYCKQNGYTSLNNANFFRELVSVFRNLKERRPRNNAKRERYINGIKIKVQNVE